MTADVNGSNALDDTNRRLSAVLDNATVAIFLMNDRQRCVYMNRAAEELTGYTLSEVVAIDKPLHDIVHHTRPDGRPFPLEECAIDRAFPEHNQVQGEEIFVHKDRYFYPVAFTASPIRDEESQTIGTIIEVRDITEQKAAEERQRLLMNELNHRVKNTLASVQAIAWQTFKDVDSRALGRFDARLHALSQAHDILTSASWAEARLMQVVETIIRPFGGPERIRIDGDECSLHPKAVVSIAMVLHELGTNAAKYGALSTDEGKVELHWSCARIGDVVELDLRWQERGGPPVSVPERRGFGSRLIERQLANEFSGSVSLDFNPEGLACLMKLSIPTNAEALALPRAAAE